MAALVEALAEDRSVRRVYLLNQDYSFGREVAENARRMIAGRLPNVQIVGEELHPVGRVRDFAPYVEKVKASGADTVVTGNWGNDLTLLVRAAREAGLSGELLHLLRQRPRRPGRDRGGRRRPRAGSRRVAPERRAGVDGARLPGVPAALPGGHGTTTSRRVRSSWWKCWRGRSNGRARTESLAVARALSGMTYGPADGNPLGAVSMRATDHQLIGPLVVSVMQKSGAPGVPFDVEGSGFGFRPELAVRPSASARATTCRMAWPSS